MSKKPAKTPIIAASPKAPSAAETKALAICKAHGNKPDELIEILHALQHDLGFVPEAVLPAIANALNLSRAEVHGVVTFYHEFRRTAPGAHVIKICRAEACQAMGVDMLCDHAEKKLGTEIGGTSKNGKYSIDAVYCLGNCALSPAIMIGEKLYGKVDPKRFDTIVATLEKESAA
jgi:formate dehydrogenase subunit gamma